MCYNELGDNMKKNEYINVRIDEDTKTKAEEILKNFNLRISDAINNIFTTSIRRRYSF